MGTKKLFEKRSVGQRIVFVIVFIMFALYAVSLLYPFIWAFYNSMKAPLEYTDNSFIFPKQFDMSNFIKAFEMFKVSTIGGKQAGLIQMFLNSLLLTALTTFLAVFGSICVAYVLSKYKFPGSGFVFSASVFIMIIPMIGSTPALYAMMSKLKITDNILFCSILMGGCFGVYFMLMYGAFKSLSWNYAEAGYVDGANDFVIFFKIMLPQVWGQVFALCLICAIGVWNEYFNPYVFMPNLPTLSTGLYMYQVQLTQNFNKNYPLFFAGLLISCLPMLIVFICFQNVLMSSTSAGGLKG